MVGEDTVRAPGVLLERPRPLEGGARIRGSMARPPLFVGLTTWNSDLFLEACLDAVRATTEGTGVELFAVDNGSEDRTLEILRAHGVEFEARVLSQPDALNRLLDRSRSPYTLLIHPDTVLLEKGWFERLAPRFDDPDLALISPEDIGCGPMTRPWGEGKPESSFLLFHTRRARRARNTRWVRRFRFPRWPQRVLDFYSPSVTHRLPERLAAADLRWHAMEVLASRTLDELVYRPAFDPPCWDPELEHLEYGLGNFYALDGRITHYHNWFDRFRSDVSLDSEEVTEDGIPRAYLRTTSERFLRDFRSGGPNLPRAGVPRRSPRRLGPEREGGSHPVRSAAPRVS